MKFYSKYSRPPKQHEKGGGKRITESAGYIPAKKQIENIIAAGERLVAYREGMYDFPDGKDNGFNDPSRDPNFDMADASELLSGFQKKVDEEAELQARVKKYEEEQREKIKDEQKSQEEEKKQL